MSRGAPEDKLDRWLECDQTIWQATSPPERSYKEMGRSLGPDPSLYEPPRILATAMASGIFHYEHRKAYAAGETTVKPKAKQYYPPKKKLAEMETQLLEVMEEEHEEAEMPADYPSTDLLRGIHAHTARYYESHGCLNSEKMSATDTERLPNMYRRFAPSALVALGILMQENVRHQMASAQGQWQAPPTRPSKKKKRKGTADVDSAAGEDDRNASN